MVYYIVSVLFLLFFWCPCMVCNSILLLPWVMVYYIVSVLFLLFFWCLCMRLMYGYTYNKSMDQPGKVANPARGQLNRENEYSPVCVRA